MRQWQNINIMMQFGSVGIFSLFKENPIGQRIPNVDLLHQCNVVEAQRSLWEKLEFRFWWLHPRRYRPLTSWYAKAIAQELKEVLAEFQPDLVVTDIAAYRYLPVIKDYGCRLILDEHNVEAIALKQSYSARYLTENRKLTLKKNIEVFLDISQIRSIERDSIHQADQVWTCSDTDDKLLQNLYGRVPYTQVVPNSIDVSHYDCVRLGKCSLPEGLERKQRNLLYSGKFSYFPNAVAVDLLIDHIYPRLRQVYPDCRLLLVGRHPTQRMLEAAEQDSTIIVTGEIPDVRPYLAAASVMAVPLHHGGGTRLKILEAFAAGCPVISTAKGAEGLKVQDGEHLLIRNEIEAIFEGVCQLWSDPTWGQKLAKSAYELVNAEYSWSAVGGKVESAVRELF
jgi:glycosyltransferase involved in cell wall biosynthesis